MFGNHFLTRADWCPLEHVFHFLLDNKRNLSGLQKDVGIFAYPNLKKKKTSVNPMNSLQGSSLIALFREDKNTMWVAQRPPPGCDRAWSTGPPTHWSIHPYMWWEWRLWANAVPWQHRTVLVCGPKWTGNPWDSLWSWQQTNVWVNHTVY